MKRTIIAITIILAFAFTFANIDTASAWGKKEKATRTGVKRIQPEFKLGPDGMTNEQRNIKMRMELDQQPGTIKHLYIISTYSGKIMLYSTVKGKVTSSGKRLNPKTATSQGGHGSHFYGMPYSGPSGKFYSSEVQQDDGTFGGSIEYLFWFDAQGRYHQQYVTGGLFIHVSDKPIPIPDDEIMINIVQ